MIRHYVILFTVVLISSCSSSPTEKQEKESASQEKEFNKSEVVTEVTKALNNYAADVRESGYIAELKYLDASEDFFWTPPGYAHSISYDSVVKVLEVNAPRFKKIDNQYETLKVVALSSEIASFTARINSSVTDTSGTTLNYTLIETGVWVKRKEGWKLVCGHTEVN